MRNLLRPAMKRVMAWPAMLSVAALLLTGGCGRGDARPDAEGRARVQLALNWVPEPEFGGFFAARLIDAYARHALEVDILPGGAGTPTVQMVGAGSVEFAVASADEIVIARSQGIDVVALFAVYQTCPQGIMVHARRGLTDIAQVFESGTLAMEQGLPYQAFLADKYGMERVKVVPYAGGIAQFLADPMLAQQCFVFAEPITARRQGAEPKVFLVADAGYNPYTTVLITSGRLLRQQPQVAAAMTVAVGEGWRAYLDDPEPANRLMQPMNPAMDLEAFALGAQAQVELIENDFTRAAGLGTMQVQRWQTLIDQLLRLGRIPQAPPAEECFMDLRPAQ